MVLIISLVHNHDNSVLFNNSGSVSFQGISSNQINDLLILVSSANFHKILIVQSSDIFSWLNFRQKQQSPRSVMLNFQFLKNHYFERVNILFFKTDPLNYIFLAWFATVFHYFSKITFFDFYQDSHLKTGLFLCLTFCYITPIPGIIDHYCVMENLETNREIIRTY